jgi:hypothetical protein
LPVGLFLEWLRASRRTWLAGVGAALCAASIVITGAATFINYVPDNVSNVFLGLAVPLLRSGYLPPSVLNFVGFANPVAGVLLGVTLLGLAAWVFARLGALDSRWPGMAPLLAGLVGFVVLLGVQVATARHHEGDQGAMGFLQKVWLVQPGQPLSFWPSRPDR